MKVFVTGATGFIGFAIVKELLAAGHTVTGLARTEASGKKLVEAGARVQIGGVEDLEGLRRGAAAADGAIHTAFYHKLSHIPLGRRLGVLLGGLPTGIVGRYLNAAVMADRQALEAMGGALAGSGRALVAPFATMAMREGRLALEDEAYDPTFFAAPRAETEKTLQGLAEAGVRTSAIRLAPTVHGAGDEGFLKVIVKTARKKKESAYVGSGENRWPAVHRLDAARLFRLALEKGPAGGTYHGVAEEGIAFKEIAELIGRRLSVPVVSKSVAEAEKQFSFLAGFVRRDNPASGQLTQERLGWTPREVGLMADLEGADYFSA